LDERGHVRTDARLATSINGIWAIGDVTGRMPFTAEARRTRRSRWALIPLLVLVAAVPVTVLAVTRSGGSDEANDGEATSPAARTHAGLCTALALADDDDVSGARAAFYDRSHDGLHELAATATDVDPAAAARLLEAKQRVESLLDGGAPTRADLTSALGGLADATARAAEDVGEPDVKGCD
jgi:hypothetical protein